MFGSIEVPFESVMLFNEIKLKPNVDFDDVEMALAEVCSVVSENYSDENGGFIAGQVFKYAGFVSEVGSLGASADEDEDAHVVVVTYWRSFTQHEKSHLDSLFKEKFDALAKMCSETKELGYELLWQGMRKKPDQI